MTDTTVETITSTLKEYRGLKISERELNRLDGAGVDNWHGYGAGVDNWHGYEYIFDDHDDCEWCSHD